VDSISFIIFSVNTRYVTRWITGGLMLFIPVLNFFSLGYLARASSMFMIGGIGLPTWERKDEVWKEGAKLLYILILYEAVPSFLFSCAFLLASFGNFLTVFMAGILKILAAIAFLLCSFFIPFAVCSYAEDMEVRRAFEFERIARGVREVLARYIVGYLLSGVCIYAAYMVHRIPYLVGFIVSSIAVYYVLLVATHYYTQLYKGTSITAGRSEPAQGVADGSVLSLE